MPSWNSGMHIRVEYDQNCLHLFEAAQVISILYSTLKKSHLFDARIFMQASDQMRLDSRSALV